MKIDYMQFPAWLENNRVFRTLFLLRKLYFTRSKYSHYSQYAEDVTIKRCFAKGYQGFFVDVGCFHPKKYNNTWSLYKRGWRGINIDIDAIKIEGFQMVRPLDINIHRAVSNVAGEFTYWANGLYSLTTSMDESFTENKQGYVKRTAQCSRLTEIIDSTPYKGRKIDFLSIDAEGHDLEVIASLDFARYDPSLIAVETHKRVFTEVAQTELYGLLTQKGYSLVGWCGFTLLMANPSLQSQLSSLRA